MRCYVELLRVLEPHSINIPPEQVLSPQVHGLWKMVNFLILVQLQDILNGRVSRPNEIVVFASLEKLKSSSFHGVDNCIVYVSPFGYQEGHEEVLDVASSWVALDEVCAVWLELVNVAWVWEEGCWRTALEF